MDSNNSFTTYLEENSFKETPEETLHEQAEVILFEKIIFLRSWSCVAVAVALLLPLAVFSFVLQQYSLVFAIGTLLLMLLSVPFWFPALGGFIGDVAGSISTPASKKKSLYLCFARATLLKRRVIFNSTIFLTLSVLLSLFLWYAHISRPSFNDFDSFVETELHLSKEHAVGQADLMFFTIHRVKTPDNEDLVYVGFFGRFTPYLNLNLSEETELRYSYEPPSSILNIRE